MVEPRLIHATRRPSKLLNRKHTPQYDLRKYLYQITGVDLTQIDGIGEQIALTVVSEVGVRYEPVENGEEFCFLVRAEPEP